MRREEPCEPVLDEAGGGVCGSDLAEPFSRVLCLPLGKQGAFKQYKQGGNSIRFRFQKHHLVN